MNAWKAPRKFPKFQPNFCVFWNNFYWFFWYNYIIYLTESISNYLSQLMAQLINKFTSYQWTYPHESRRLRICINGSNDTSVHMKQGITALQVYCLKENFDPGRHRLRHCSVFTGDSYQTFSSNENQIQKFDYNLIVFILKRVFRW